MCMHISVYTCSATIIIMNNFISKNNQDGLEVASSRALASQELNSGFDPFIGKNKRETIKKLYVP